MAFCCSGRGKTLKLHSYPSGAMPHAALTGETHPENYARTRNISRKLQPLRRRADIARKLDSSAVVSPGSAKDVAGSFAAIQGRSK